MWLGSRSSPTTVAVRCFFLNTIAPVGRRGGALEPSAGLELAPGVLHQADRSEGADRVEDVRVERDVERVRADRDAGVAVGHERAVGTAAAARLVDRRRVAVP